MEVDPRSTTPPEGLLVRYATRISRDAAIYAAGTSSVLVFGLVQVAVYTHFMDPAEYGTLAVYVVLAGFLTIIYNLCSLQGTLMSVFGYGEGGEDGGEVVVGDGGGRAGSGAARTILSTGLAITATVSAAGTALIWLSAPVAGPLVLGADYTRDALLLAAVSGALGSLWRLAVNVPRMERRPLVFAGLNNLRPTVMVAATIPLVATGHGVDGALVGMAIGNATSLCVALVVTRVSYAGTLGIDEARHIMRRGMNFVPVVVALWTVHNADVYILSRYAPSADVGTYRLAARLSAFSSYFVSAFLMSWSPLERTSLFRATYAAHGRAVVRSMLVTYYVVIGLGLALALSLGADALVRIAPPTYASAARLIPLIALGLVVYGLFNVLARTGSGLRGHVIYPVLSVVCALTFLVAGILLTPALHGYGAAMAIIVGMLPGIAGYVVAIARSDDPVPFEWGNVAITCATAGTAYGFAVAVGPAAGSLHWAIDLSCFLAYIAVMLAAGVVPRAHIRPLLRVARSTLPGGKDDLVEQRIETLDTNTAELMRRVAREKRPVADVGGAFGLTPDEAYARLDHGLRTIAGLSPRPAPNREVLEYLTWRGAGAERDLIAEQLMEGGVDPFELDALENAFARARSL